MVCDLDRTTGLFPALALRDSGAPLVAYKDLFGADMFDRFENDPSWNCGPGGRCNPDELQFFALDQGTQMPRPVPEPPFAPGRFSRALDLIPDPATAAPTNPDGSPNFTADVKFGQRQMVTCAALASWAGEAFAGGVFADFAASRRALNPLLASILMTCRFDFTIMRGHNDKPLPLPLDLGTRAKESLLAQRLAALRQSRPDITIFQIANPVGTEDVERIAVAIFGELFHADDNDSQMRNALSMGQVLPALAALFAAAGLGLAAGPIVDIVDPRANVAPTHWRIRDSWPELLGRTPSEVTYDVALSDNTLTVAPTAIATGFARGVPMADATCQLNAVIDSFAPFLSAIFANVTRVGDPPVRRPVAIYSTGAVPLRITAASFRIVDLAGNALPDYRLLDVNGVSYPPADTTIPPGGSLNLQVEFAPTTLGPHPGLLDLTSTNSDVPAVGVAITGTGV